jgi:hypothetical protein
MNAQRLAQRKPSRKQLEQDLAEAQARAQAREAEAAAAAEAREAADREASEARAQARAAAQADIAATIRAAEQARRLAQPATATPPAGGHAEEALWPAERGTMRIWLCCTDDRGQQEGYRLRLIQHDIGGMGWSFTKHSDGTTYHLHQDDGLEIYCDCPGGTAHGPRCAGGRGCKHARMLRALRALVGPG